MMIWMIYYIWIMTRKASFMEHCIQADDSDHHVSGPFHVPGAQPGDVLEIDILEYASACHTLGKG
jgi:acetamidase/formamidase